MRQLQSLRISLPRKEVSAPKVEDPVLPEAPCSHRRIQKVPPTLQGTCVPSRPELTHGCCWLISGHPSPAPSGQPNTTSEESQLLEPGEETILRGSQSAF